jgi:ABC-type transporter Mla MlaB component
MPMIPTPGGRPTNVTPRDIHATVVLVCGPNEVASWPLTGDGRPDLSAVEALARLQVAARRLGCSIQLRDTCAELSELLHLAGLRDVVTGRPGPGRCLEVVGEPEGGEQVGVEEVVMPDDPVT